MKDAVYVFLTKSNSPVARLVRRRLPGQWSHSALSLDADLFEMYSFGARKILNPFSAGLKHESIFHGAYPKQRTMEVCLLRVEVTREQLCRVHEVVNWFLERWDTMKFNVKGMLQSARGEAVEIENRYFCSEFVYDVLKRSGVVDFGIARNLVTPNHFLRLDHCSTLYQGLLGPLQDCIAQRNPDALEAFQVTG